MTNPIWPKQATVWFLLVVAICLIAVSSVQASDYQTLEWTELMPAADLAAIENQIIDHNADPDRSSSDWDSEAESERGIFGSEIESWDSPQDIAQNQAYQSALVSTRTVDEFDGKDVRVPGFIVPLEFNDDLTVTQFFLVPYFGACIHLPPPPPNQMILVDYPEGLKLEDLFTPFWVSGTLSVRIVKNELGTSAYAMQMGSIEVYTE